MTSTRKQLSSVKTKLSLEMAVDKRWLNRFLKSSGSLWSHKRWNSHLPDIYLKHTYTSTSNHRCFFSLLILFFLLLLLLLFLLRFYLQFDSTRSERKSQAMESLLEGDSRFQFRMWLRSSFLLLLSYFWLILLLLSSGSLSFLFCVALAPFSLPLCCSEQFPGSFRAVLGQSWGRFGVSFSVDSP